MLTDKQIELIKVISDRNDPNYTTLKTVEELNELSLVLMQKFLKGDKVNDQEIIDEIGDVLIRMEFIKLKYNKEDILKRINKKLTNYEEWIKLDKYKNI